jgi:hypothetical protein
MQFRLAASSLLAVTIGSSQMWAAEQHANALSQLVRARHMLYGTVIDPVFASPDSEQITGYTRCGDSAIWTGHYLAAESFRHKVSRSQQALDNVNVALYGLRTLVDVTGTDLLARCYVPAASAFAAGIIQEEARHGVRVASLGGAPYYWIGNTSRDQYCGAFFGLAVAFDMVDDAGVRASASYLITRMLNFLLRNNWNVRMPDGSISTTFAARPDQQLTLLQIGRRVNSGFDTRYAIARLFQSGSVGIPIAFEVLDDHGSYFKFNLDTINFYNLIRLESSSFRWFYDEAYDVLRRTTNDHGNAHFNMIDRALRGPNAARDAATVAYLNEWLLRSRRDPYVDLRQVYSACGTDRACAPIPVEKRVRTDFLWQRSPFLLYGGGDGLVEGAGIDYTLPYWMARFYGVIVE